MSCATNLTVALKKPPVQLLCIICMTLAFYCYKSDAVGVTLSSLFSFFNRKTPDLLFLSLCANELSSRRTMWITPATTFHINMTMLFFTSSHLILFISSPIIFVSAWPIFLDLLPGSITQSSSQSSFKCLKPVKSGHMAWFGPCPKFGISPSPRGCFGLWQ